MSENQFGRRINDVMPLESITPEMLANLSDSQRMNLRIVQSLSNINSTISQLNNTLELIKTDVAHHDKVLITGNGEPSMQERLRNVERYIGGVQYWSRIVGGAILVQTLTFFAATIIAIIRVLPLLEKLVAP